MVSQKKWDNLSTDEKVDALHDEIKTTESHTRSLKKIVTGITSRLNEIRRYLGMRTAA